MKKTYLIVCVNGVFLIIVLLFVKYEMDENRKQLSQDLTKAMHDSPGTIVRDTISQLGIQVTNTAVTNGAPQAQRSDPLGSLLDAAANTVQRVERTASGATADNGATNSAGQPGTNDAVGALLNLATDTERRVDQMALRATEITDEEEMEFGRQLDAEILKDMPPEADPANATHLESLAKGLLSQCQRKQMQYHFRVVTSQTVNAFSIAGGYVYITTAYLKKFSSDPELAITLGHEIAHVELKHAVHKVQYEYHGQKIFGSMFSIVQAGYAVLSSPYAKEEEFDADAWGFAACKKAGWAPDQLLAFFEHLEKYEQEHQQPETTPSSEFERRMGTYFDSHPSTADRLARLKGM